MQAGLAPCRRAFRAHAATRTIGTAGQSPGFRATPDQKFRSGQHALRPFLHRLGVKAGTTLSQTSKTRAPGRRLAWLVELLRLAGFRERIGTAGKIPTRVCLSPSSTADRMPLLRENTRGPANHRGSNGSCTPLLGYERFNTMWLNSYVAPVLVLLAAAAVGLGFVEFHSRPEPGADEPVLNKPIERDAGQPNKPSTVGFEALQRRLGVELEQLQKRQEAERKQNEEMRRTLSMEVFTREDSLRRLEQHFAGERDREARAAAGLEEEQQSLEKAYRTLDPIGQLGKDHSEIRKLDTSLQQVRSQLAERVAQFTAREEKVAAEMIEMRLNLEAAKQKLKFEDDRWSRRAASLDATIAQLRRSQETMALRRDLPEIDRPSRTEVDDARASRIEEKLDQLSRELAELKQQLTKP